MFYYIYNKQITDMTQNNFIKQLNIVKMIDSGCCFVSLTEIFSQEDITYSEIPSLFQHHFISDSAQEHA